jgi:RNA polymerase subunit RPABC4/transcription elongation factor Spt4
MNTLIIDAELDHERNDPLFIRACHQCHQVSGDVQEMERCPCCNKSHLPLKYFEKIHDVHTNYSQLFSSGKEFTDKDMIKGVTVLW